MTRSKQSRGEARVREAKFNLIKTVIYGVLQGHTTAFSPVTPRSRRFLLTNTIASKDCVTRAPNEFELFYGSHSSAIASFAGMVRLHAGMITDSRVQVMT